jgi:hypothetical protein
MADPKSAPKAPKPESKPKGKKYEVTLVDAAKSELRCVAAEKDGKFVTFVRHSLRTPEGKKVPQGRGATVVHTSFDRAKAAVDASAEQAATMGWTRKARGVFGGNRPDTFDLAHLPAPARA